MFKTLQAQKCWSTFSNGEICLKDELKINYAYHFPLFSSRFHDYIFPTLASPPGFKVPDIMRRMYVDVSVCTLGCVSILAAFKQPNRGECEKITWGITAPLQLWSHTFIHTCLLHLTPSHISSCWQAAANLHPRHSSTARSISNKSFFQVKTLKFRKCFILFNLNVIIDFILEIFF